MDGLWSAGQLNAVCGRWAAVRVGEERRGRADGEQSQSALVVFAFDLSCVAAVPDRRRGPRFAPPPTSRARDARYCRAPLNAGRETATPRPCGWRWIDRRG